MSYGTNTPFGFQPRYMLTSGTFNGQVTTNFIASGYNTSIFTGDPVIYAAASDGTITPAAPAGPVLGVFQQCKFKAPNNDYVNSPYWPANSVVEQNLPAEAFVATDSTIVYAVQVSNSATLANPTASAALVQTNIGQNASFGVIAAVTPPPAGTSNNPGTGSPRGGQSGYYLDFSTIGNGATLPLKIIGIEPNPQNQFGQAFNVALVIFNNDVLKGGTGTAGI